MCLSLGFLLLTATFPRAENARDNPMELALDDSIESYYPRDARKFLLKRLRAADIDAAARRFESDWRGACRKIHAHELRCVYRAKRKQNIAYSFRSVSRNYSFDIRLHTTRGLVTEIEVCLTTAIEGTEIQSTRCEPEETRP